MRKLAVFFPGIGYTVDMPMMYYSRRLSAGLGYEIKLLPYGGFPGGVRGDPGKMAECYRLALRQSTEMLSGVPWAEYDDVLFFGKSIGTILGAWFALKSPARERIRLVLYTPMEDAFPFGHGEKSVFLIERFLRLKPAEAMAIRWHMGGFDEAVRGGSIAISLAFDKYPLAVKLHLADLEATYLREQGTSVMNK